MVSELAGEGAVSPQLPAPTSHAELQVRLRRQIRSSLRRGVVFPEKTVALFNPSTMFIPLSLDGSSRSRSVEISSRVLVNPLFAVFNRSSWSRSVRSSAELDLVCLSKVLVSSMFTIFIRIRSAKISSAELVVVVSLPQRRTRKKKQLLTPIRDFASEKSQGERRVSDIKNRVGELRSEIKSVIAKIEEAKQFKESMSAVLVPICAVILVNLTAENRGGSIAKVLDRVLEEEFSENDQHRGSEKSSFNSSVAYHEAVLENGGEELKSSKLSGIIIPGFAPLDLVWLDTTKLLSDVYCRLMCMLLNPYNQTNHLECKSRPDSGLSAIAKLDPGYIIGQLSSVWKEWIKWCIEFGVDAHAITAVQYDWRLQPSKLEERDLYFHKLKLSLLTFETSLKHHGGQQIVFAHSLGVEDLGGMVELVEGSVVDLDGLDVYVIKVGVAVYAEFCRDWGEALRMYDGAYHVLREMATSWCTDKMESSLIAMLKVVGLVAVVVKSLIDVLFGIGADLYTSEQKNDDDPFANVSFRSNNGIFGSSSKEKGVPQNGCLSC